VLALYCVEAEVSQGWRRDCLLARSPHWLRSHLHRLLPLWRLHEALHERKNGAADEHEDQESWHRQSRGRFYGANTVSEALYAGCSSRPTAQARTKRELAHRQPRLLLDHRLALADVLVELLGPSACVQTTSSHPSVTLRQGNRSFARVKRVDAMASLPRLQNAPGETTRQVLRRERSQIRSPTSVCN